MSLDFYYHEIKRIFDDMNVIDEDAKIIEYTISYQKKMVFSLYISQYDEFASANLKNVENNVLIFSIGVENFSDIIREESTLKLYKSNKEKPALVVQLKPFVHLYCEASSPYKDDV